MKPIFLLLIPLAGVLVLLSWRLCGQGTPVPMAYNPYQNYPVYHGTDLGVTYSPLQTIVKVWSPPAEAMKIRLYRAGTGHELIQVTDGKKGKTGVWTFELKGDRKGEYYTVSAQIKGKWGDETADPYATAVGLNGQRGEILDLHDTNPSGWDHDKAPELKNPTDAVICELHVRDASIDPASGIKNKGKFLGLAESGTVNTHGQGTGLDHLAEMGITHVHLLPSFDFITIDESKPNVPQYNWGYDPQNYNVPEGSYSTDPADGTIRIREFKEMVMAMHRKGLRVVMDVVYNHTARIHTSSFDLLVPGYYYRQWQKEGSYSNASGCGNETASDREMVRKFIVESVTYWAKEYHVDGFRFDLMAIHDIETMNAVSAALHAIDPSILVYGEGWTAGDSPLPEKYRALKNSATQLNGIAVFSDDIRDAIKGSVFDDKSTGFVSGATNCAETVKYGIVGGGQHPQIDYPRLNYSKQPYTNAPSQAINYVSCHDNHTLYDKLKVSRGDASEEDLIRMDKLAAAIVLTSQGIPFLHAGEEMKRTKGGEHNSFNKPDSVNEIRWEWKYTNRDLVEYYKALIALRKAHPAFRMPAAEMIRTNLEFLPVDDPQVVAYQLKDHANGDNWGTIVVVFNGSKEEKKVILPAGAWKPAILNGQFITQGAAVVDEVVAGPVSATILYR